ncbi:hypothetical protein ALO64_100414 [Pseudomonas meliae]|uniref:Uncharacterized protein n=1 Tax=Pseudomonas meliae TaxID=86176 RepID=A0A0P9Z5W5_9PSED|nr:hypothetical protein ALO64_100414 [Pseudomonas meliae]
MPRLIPLRHAACLPLEKAEYVNGTRPEGQRQREKTHGQRRNLSNFWFHDTYFTERGQKRSYKPPLALSARFKLPRARPKPR